jgi:hypothetical protein
VNRKADITKKILELLPEQHRVSLDTAMHTWWRNIRPRGGLALTDRGLVIFQDLAEIECHEFVIPKDQMISQGMLLRLDRGQEWPYHLDRRRRITFFGSKEAMMMALYGDLGRYVDGLPKS